MDIKQVLALIDSAEHPKQPLTEGRSMAKKMVMQHYAKQEIKTPVKQPVSKLNEYFKVVDNEMLNVIKEQQDAKQVAVKKIVNRVLNRLDEGKKADTPKPRNFVAKNAVKTTSGAGAHKDKKRAEKQGDVKHKKDRVPMDVAEGDDLGSMSHREFKRREMEHELGHEDTPEFKRMMRDADRGPWYIKIDGKIFKQKGEPKMFDWKKGANNYALAILKNKPELQGKITLTKRLPDENEGVAEKGYGTHPSQRVDPRTGKKYVPPKSPLGKGVAEGDEPDEQYLNKVISDLHKDALGVRPDREFGREWMSSSYEEKLRIYNNMLKNLHSDMDEATGDEKFDTIMRTIKKGTNKQATADRREREADSRQRAKDAFGPSPADRLSIRSNKDVEEDSDWGEPREILEDVLQTLEREVEWPLSEVMDPREFRPLLSALVRAVNDKLLSMDRIDEVAGAEKCWPGHKKAGTQPGTGKNAGKRVNKCVKVGEETDVDESGLQYYTGKKKYGKEGMAALAKAGRKGASEEELGRIKDKYKTIKEDISVGSVVKVYSNVLKKPVYGHVVDLKENKAYVNYANTKIVMAHPVDKVELAEVAGLASKFIPGVGLVAGGYDAYQRAKQGDYTGAALSAGAGLSSLVPGVGTAAATGLIGAQLGRDKARTGSFLPSYDEIGAAGKQGQAATAAPAAAPASSGYTIQKGDTLTKIAKANNTTIKDIMAANPQITDPNKIAAGAKLTLPGQSAAPAATAAAAAVPKSGGAVDATRTTQKTTQVPPAEAPKQAATPAALAPASGVPTASVTDRKVTQQPTAVTKQGNVTTTTSGSSASGTLKGITQDMVMNHPVYKAEMAKAAGKDPIQANMARRRAELLAKSAIMKDPSYLQNYKAPPPIPTGNSRIDNF